MEEVRMKTISSRNTRRIHRLSALIALVGFSASMMAMAEERSKRWRIEAGPAYRGNMKAEVSGSSRTQESGAQVARPARLVPGMPTAPVLVVDPNPEPAGSPRAEFDDGFVEEDWGFTTEYDFDHPNQYYSDANTLTFTRASSESDTVVLGQGIEMVRSLRTDLDVPFKDSGRFDGWGVRTDALFDLTSQNGFDIAFLLGFRGYWKMDQQFLGTTFRQKAQELQTTFQDQFSYNIDYLDTYVYDTLPGVPPVPDTNPINDTPRPASRDVTAADELERIYTGTRTTSWTGENRVSVEIDSALYQLAVGPAFSGVMGGRVAVNVRPLLLLNLLDVELDRREEFVATAANGQRTVLNAWRDRETKTEFLLGAGVEAGLSFGITQNLFIGVNGGYEWIEKASIDVGPNTVSLDFSAYTASAVFGANF
jgi:opacity protein-like surface antigen